MTLLAKVGYLEGRIGLFFQLQKISSYLQERRGSSYLGDNIAATLHDDALPDTYHLDHAIIATTWSRELYSAHSFGPIQNLSELWFSADASPLIMMKWEEPR